MYIIVNDEVERFKQLEYKDIVNYEISNYGKVRVKHTGQILKPYIDKDGYERVILYNKSKKYNVAIHRLVALNFLCTTKQGIVNHKDNNRRHNYYKNLEWVTQKENVFHAIEHGSFDRHRLKKCVLKTYSESTIEELCLYISKGKTTTELVEIFQEIPRPRLTSLIHDLKNKRSWKHISNKYF